MTLELQVKVSRPVGAPLVSMMGPVVMELLLIEGQQEKNDLNEKTE